jgi:GT2 family glycosyltransferase
VVIPARRTDQTLPACLEALRAARRAQQFEVVIVRDGAGFVQEVADVRQLHSPVVDSAAAARNHGAAELRQGILIFLDADVLVDESSLELLVQPILSGAADATVGNYSRDVKGLTFFQSYKQLHISTVYGRRGGYLKSEFWTAIGAVRAEVFHQLGGFNAGFHGACGEDTELGHRLSAAGFRVLAVPRATGKHLHHFTLAKLLLNDLKKGTQTALNALRHRNLLSDNRHSARPEMVAVFCAALLPSLLSLAGTLPAPVVAAVASLAFGGWLLSRQEQLRMYARQDLVFLIRAIPLAMLLDWVRVLCVVVALTRFACERSGRNPPTL